MTSESRPFSFGLRARRRVRIVPILLILVVTLLPGPGGRRAEAQSPPEARIDLVHQPLFLRGDDDLGLRVKVINRGEAPIEGFQVQTSVYERIENRSELHDSFDGGDTTVVGTDIGVFPQTLQPTESTVVEVDPPLSALPAVTVEGVYPMTLTLIDAGPTQLDLDGFTSQLILYPEKVEVPLNMSLVVPVAPQPARGPAGTFVTDVAGNYPMEAALSDDGWLRGLLEGVREGARRGMRLGLAPSPRFVEEIASMSDGYVRSVGEETETVEADAPTASSAASAFGLLEGLLQNDGIQPLPSPYSGPDLPMLYKTFSLERVSEQLDVGDLVLESTMPDVSFDRRWLFAPGARWDEQTLERVRPIVGGDLKTFVGSSFFEDPIDENTKSCPPSPDAASGNYTCSVKVETENESVPALVRDPDVQNRFAELATPGGDTLDLQRLFAETAFIHLERPGVARRVVHATVPAHSRPRPRTSIRLFRGLSRAPWLVTRTPEEAIGLSVDPQPQTIVGVLDDLREKPNDTYFEDVKNAEDLLQKFNEIDPPAQRSERLRRNLFVADSRSWWVNDAETERGHEYALATQDEILDEFEKITISGPNTTLTSKRSAIEVNVFNETTYPVTVDVNFEPSIPGAIRIDDSDTDELQNLRVEPGEAPAINVDAIAQSSGIFQVKASVLSPVTGYEINQQSITIRSTNFNEIALGLTLGALAFLILFYVLRVVRRRRKPPETASESPSS